MAEFDEQELLSLIGTGNQEESTQAYDRLLNEGSGDPELDTFISTGGPARGWQAGGLRILEGLRRNLAQFGAAPSTLRAVALEATGNRQEATAEMAEAERIERSAPSALWRLQDIENPEEFAYWLSERFGENALTLLAAFASGGAGGLIGGLGARALGGGLAAQRAAMTSGMLTGGFLASAPLETAATAQEQFQVTGGTRPGLSIPAGVVKGVLELWTPMRVLQALSLPGRQLGRTVVGATARTTGREALTEGMQEGIDIGLRMLSDSNYSFFGDGPSLSMGKGAWRLAEATVAGGALGGLIGAPSAVIESRQERARERKEEGGGLAPGEQEEFILPTDVPRNILRQQPEGLVEVYRGDAVGFERPDVTRAAMSEPGLFFTNDLEEAEVYSKRLLFSPEAAPNIRREVLDTRNFKNVDATETMAETGPALAAEPVLRREAEKAKAEGYSGLIVNLPPRVGKTTARTQYVVWDQSVIKEPEAAPRDEQRIYGPSFPERGWASPIRLWEEAIARHFRLEAKRGNPIAIPASNLIITANAFASAVAAGQPSPENIAAALGVAGIGTALTLDHIKDIINIHKKLKETEAKTGQASEEGTRFDQDLTERAVEYFGLTEDMGRVGYILPDGRKLDFGVQGTDTEKMHDEVYEVLPENLKGVGAVVNFMNATGAIRYGNISGGFEATGMPTDQQIRAVLRSMAQRFRGDELYIDYTDPNTGQVTNSTRIDKPTVEKIKNFFQASIRIKQKEKPVEQRTPEPEPVPELPINQDQAGPVSVVRDLVLRGPRLDRDLRESTQPNAEEDAWAVGPLLRSGIPTDLTDMYLDLVESAVPRYLFRSSTGAMSNEVMTNTEIEYALATREVPSAKPDVLLVDQTSLVPAGITASLLDLPEASDRRIWFLPGVRPEEQLELLGVYGEVQKAISNVRSEILTGVVERNQMLEGVKPYYDSLLSAGLRVVPSRGSSFYYMGNAPVSATEIDPLTHTGRTEWWTYLESNGVIYPAREDVLDRVSRRVGLSVRTQGLVPVTIDVNKFRQGEVSALPHLQGDGNPIYFRLSGVDPEKFGGGSKRAVEERLVREINDMLPDYDKEWTRSNIEKFRDLMKKGVYIDPEEFAYMNQLVTIRDVKVEDLVEAVDYDKIGLWNTGTYSVRRTGSMFPAKKWAVSVQPGSTRIEAANRVANSIRRWLPVFEKVTKDLGIEGAPVILVRDAHLNEWGTVAYVEAAKGEMVFPIGAAHEWLGLTGSQLDARVYTVLAHEIGHLVTFKFYEKLSVEMQQQLYYAYHKLLLAERVKVPGIVQAFVPSSLGSGTGFDTKYYMSYSEWLAEQFRRFTTSDAVVLSEMDKVFKTGADYLTKYINEAMKFSPKETKFLFEPDYFFSAFIEYLRSYGDTKKRLQQISKNQLLYAVDTDVWESPALTNILDRVLKTLEGMRHMMPEGHPFNLLFSPALDPALAEAQKDALARTIAHGPSNKILLEIALGSMPNDTETATEVFAHELIHAYRMLGLITQNEMSVLYRAAIDENKGLSAGLKGSISNQVRKMALERGWSKEQTQQVYEAVLREETVAYYVGEYARTGRAPEEARGILERLIEFWNKVKTVMRGLGFRTKEDILRAFFNGEMAQRGTKVVEDQDKVTRFIRSFWFPEEINWDKTIDVDGVIEARVEVNLDEDDKVETATYQFYEKATNKIVGQIQVEVEAPRGFNVIMQNSNLPGKSWEWIQFISKDLGVPPLAPPILTRSGLRALSRQYPDVLTYYVPNAEAGNVLYYSPKYIKEQLEIWERVFRGITRSGQYQGRTIASEQYVNARQQVRYWRRLMSKVPKDIWTTNKHLLDQVFMLPKNNYLDEVQGSLVREGVRADEAQLEQILGRSQKPGSTFDSFTLASEQKRDSSRRTAAEQLGIVYADASAPQPEVRNIRRILSWVDYRGATTDPRYEGYLKRVPTRIIISQEADRIGFFSRVYWGLRQLVWRNEHITGLQVYNQKVEQYHATITSWHREADDIARLWEAQIRDPKQRENFNRLLQWLVEMDYRSPYEVSGNVVRHPTQQELLRQMTRLGLDPAARTFLANIYQHPTQVLGGARKDIFARFLDAVEQVSVANIMRTLTGNPVAQAQAVAALRAEMNQLRAKPYVPISRFGQHSITVRDSDPTKNNRVLWFSTYDNHRARDAALPEVARLFPLDHIHKGRVPEEFFEFLGLPGPLIREIKNNLPGVTPGQIAWLEQLEMQNLPDKSFRKRWVPRVGTPGYSMDFFRSFAHYFMHGSRYLSRLQYRNEMYDSIASVEASVEGLPNGSKRRMIVDYMKAHLRYIMEGGKDWAKLKAGISLLQLGFSPAAAFMNLTQTPMVSMPWLQGVFGTAQGSQQLLKSFKAARNLKNGYVTSGFGNYAVAREEMIRQGRIDIGQAAELGSYAEGNNLLGLLAGTRRQRMYRQFVWYGMIMFQRAEQINREVMMHAAWELAHKQMATNARIREIDAQYFLEAFDLSRRLSTPTQAFTHQDALAFILAKEALDQTQGLYAPYARPPFMRHPVAGTLLIFYQFIQLMTYAFRYNPGLMQLWLMMAFVYGVSGLPGAEDINEIIRLLSKKLFGKDFDILMQSRKMVREITRGTIFDEVGPDLFLHGISRYGFGLGLLPDGYGTPSFDASANGSMGKLLPGLYEGLHAINTAARPDQFFSDVAHRAAGAGFGWFFNLAQFAMESPGTVDGHKWEQALPRTIRSMAAAFRYLPPELNPGQVQTYAGLSPSVGAATLPSGARIARFSATDPDDVAAVIGQFLGFRPTKVAEAQELRREQLEAGRVLQARRATLMIQMTSAMLSGQVEVQQEVLRAIMRYNSDIAAEGRPELSINSVQLRQSLRGRARTRVLQEEFIPPQRALRPSYERLRDLFPGVRTEQVK